MGKRILIPGLIALLLVAGVSAWLVLDPSGQNKCGGGGAGESGAPVSPALSNVEGGVSGGTPESTAHRHDADATSVQPGSQAGSKGDAAGPDGGKADRPAGTKPQPGQPGGTSAAGPSSESGGRPPHSKEMPARTPRSRIIDAPRPPNQTLGNARPVSRAIKAPVAKKLEDVSEKLKQDRRGLYAQYFAFASDPLAELAKPEAKTLAQRDAALVRIDNQVHFPNNEAFADLPFDLANFAATWDGYLVIPEQGEYWLFLGADNAARVDLDGETVLLNDVQSRYIEVSTVLELAPGLHPLRIEFAQGMLANEDSWRCAASFMYVPKGMQKPVPVPKEMLMLPDWMWSANAPIITKLSANEGEIGDEITIYGQGLADNLEKYTVSPKNDLAPTGMPTASFNGQAAHLLSCSWSEVRVRVPIGASTGKLNLWRFVSNTAPGVGLPIRGIVSNSVDFKVTTQFGLLAQWHNFNGTPSVEFEQLDSRQPDIAGIENGFHWVMRNDAPVPFAQGTLACVWEGYLGVPANAAGAFCINSVGRIRVTLDEWFQEPAETTSTETRHVRLWIGAGEERKLPLRIEWIADSNSALHPMSWEVRVQVDEITIEGNETPVLSVQTRDLPYFLLFPPATPPKPPRIASVIPMTMAGDEPPTPPFTAAPGLISVREGQQFKCNVEVFGDEEVRAAPITLSVDGQAIECGAGTVIVNDVTLGKLVRQFVGVLPQGCGEGKLTAKLGLSTSEPFYIDVANKGLIAYLYDLPNPSGYSQFPNILPLTCHTIRKEREINFGTADSFNLPFVAETFAIEWYGAIIIEQDGWYTFTSRTDDGCRVWLNGIEIIDDDNLHAPQEKSGERMRLVAGTYPFRMQFFENNQHEECLLFVAAVDLQEKELLAKQVVPKRMFTWEVHDTLPDKVATGRKADGTE